MLLLRYDLASTFLILFFLAFAMRRRRKETIIRGLTFLGLLQVAVAAMWIGIWGVTVLMAVVWVLAIDELRRAYGATGVYPALVAAFGLPVAYLSVDLLMPWCLAGIAVVTVLAFAAGKAPTRHPVFAAFFALFVIDIGAVMVRELFLRSPESLMAMFLLLSCNDAFGYLAGRRFGKIRPFPRLSPGKSLEGYLGGVIGIVVALVIMHTAAPVLQGMTAGRTILLGLFIVLFGNAGDLLFSALKRAVGIKDFGSLLPGQGGILDRFDNILFAAPILYVLWPFYVAASSH